MFKKEKILSLYIFVKNNNIWKSHGRPINTEILEQELKLKIEDYSNSNNIRDIVRSYYGLLSDYIAKNNINIFIQTRKFI